MSAGRRGIGLGGWLRRRRQRSPASDLVELCRSLHLEGWEHLTAEGGAVIVTPGDSAARQAPWHTVAAAVAAWAGPLSLLDPGEPIDGELLARLRVEGPLGPGEALDRLARGEKVLVLSATAGSLAATEELAGKAGVRTVLAAVGTTAGGGRSLTFRSRS